MTYGPDEPLPLEEAEEEPRPCEHQISLGSYLDPPEWCDEDALPGSDFCHAHDPDAREDSLVEAHLARMENYR